jgi:hypothetical protein
MALSSSAKSFVLPTETILESLKFLGRDTLDALQAVNRRFHYVTDETMKGICLRLIRKATLAQGNTIVQRGAPFEEISSPQADSELFVSAIKNTCFTYDGDGITVSFVTRQLCELLEENAKLVRSECPKTVLKTGSIVVANNDEALFRRFIRAISLAYQLRIWGCPAFYANDALLHDCRLSGITDVVISRCAQSEVAFSEEGVLDFLFGGNYNGKRSELTALEWLATDDFAERFLELATHSSCARPVSLTCGSALDQFFSNHKQKANGIISLEGSTNFLGTVGPNGFRISIWACNTVLTKAVCFVVRKAFDDN